MIGIKISGIHARLVPDRAGPRQVLVRRGLPCGRLCFLIPGPSVKALHDHPCRAHCSLRGKGVPSA
jgi:hypothetical protein